MVYRLLIKHPPVARDFSDASLVQVKRHAEVSLTLLWPYFPGFTQGRLHVERS